jgi:integrase
MKVETITQPTGLQLPILLDETGLPVPIYNEFILSRANLQTNTLIRNSYELSIFDEWIKRHNDKFLELYVKGLVGEAVINGSLVPWLRKSFDKNPKLKRLYLSPDTFNERLTTVRLFLNWHFNVVSGKMSYLSNEFKVLKESNARVESLLTSAYVKAIPIKQSVSLGLTLNQVQDLIHCVDPDNPNSYGRNYAVKYRNYVMVLVMLGCGMRPGELLSLKVDDVQHGAYPAIDVVRRSPDKNDTRKIKPNIKRNGRLLPIYDSNIAFHLDQYLVEYRDEFEERAKTPSEYLFLSDEGRPLSLKSVGEYFRIIRSRHSDVLPANITAKSLRHTFSSSLLKGLKESGLEEEQRTKILAILRGDTNLSSQDRYTVQVYNDFASTYMRRYQKSLVNEEASF